MKAQKSAVTSKHYAKHKRIDFNGQLVIEVCLNCHRVIEPNGENGRAKANCCRICSAPLLEFFVYQKDADSFRQNYQKKFQKLSALTVLKNKVNRILEDLTGSTTFEVREVKPGEHHLTGSFNTLVLFKNGVAQMDIGSNEQAVTKSLQYLSMSKFSKLG